METREQRLTRWFYYGFTEKEKMDYLIEKAKDLGNKAYWKFVYHPEQHNPYPKDSDESKSWILGWNEAEQSDSRLDEW
jgi:hypothetical protein